MSDGRINRTQWRALIAAGLGWGFDGLDGYLYILVAIPFVTQLLDKQAPDAEVILKASIIQAVFLVGWAVGGAVFGRIGDRLGRARTLTLTILTYALFTGAAFFATEWWHLLIFRFIAALGIGGEWAAGSALVSEMLHKRHRAWASATLQSCYMLGMIAASLTAGWMKGLEPRYVFLVGVLPAFLVLWIRWAVPEPEEWKGAAEREGMPGVGALFAPAMRRTTLLVIALTSIALTTVWGFLYFAPQAIRAMPEVAGWGREEVNALVMRVTIVFLIVNIVANYFATYLAKWVGYRAAFLVMLGGSAAAFLIGFRQPPSLASITLVTCAASFFALGVFGIFPLYVPPLFPTLIRTLGAGFTYNVGRLAAALGTLYGGVISAKAGGPSAAIWWLGLLYLPGLVVALMMPELTDAAREKRGADEGAGTL